MSERPTAHWSIPATLGEEEPREPHAPALDAQRGVLPQRRRMQLDQQQELTCGIRLDLIVAMEGLLKTWAFESVERPVNPLLPWRRRTLSAQHDDEWLSLSTTS